MGKKSKDDPTGQARNRNKGRIALDRRLIIAERQIKKLFRAVPRTRRQQTQIVNKSVVVYDYPLTGSELTDLQNSFRFIINRQLLESQDQMPIDWYWKENITPPYREGTGEEIVRFNQLVSQARISGVRIRGLEPQAVPIEAILLSEPYRKALDNVYVSNYSTIRTLSERTAEQVIQQVNLGMQAGNTPTEISKVITERFNVAKSSAERIARTEVNKAYNDAKIEAVDLLAANTGLRAGVIHISALIPTTRESHAARHGNAYTTADQLAWWNSGANRINCLCSTEAVLIDSKGKVVQKEFQEGIKAERSFFS